MRAKFLRKEIYVFIFSYGTNVEYSLKVDGVEKTTSRQDHVWPVERLRPPSKKPGVDKIRPDNLKFLSL
jgi:hypothetical protein